MNGEEVLETGNAALEGQLAGWTALRQSLETKALATSDAQDALSYANALEVAASVRRSLTFRC